MQSLLVFLGIIFGIFMSSRRENPYKYALKKKINKINLTGMFDTCSIRTLKKNNILSQGAEKKKNIFLIENLEKGSYLSDLFYFGASFANQ